MKNFGFRLLSASLLALFTAQSQAVEVLNFAAWKTKLEKREQCNSLLKKKEKEKEEKPAQGDIIHFSSIQPEFQNSSEFLAEMKEDNNWAYFYYADSTTPPFSKYDYGTWAVTPRFPFQTDLYILKVAPSPFVTKYPSDIGRWRMDEIRKMYKPIAYTRVRATPLFSILHLAIQQVRAVENHLKKEEYLPVVLDYAVLFQEGPLKYKLVDFVNTWRTTDDQEIAAQEMIKALIFRHISDRDQHIDVSRFVDDLGNELLKVYSPELVDSLFGSIHANNLLR